MLPELPELTADLDRLEEFPELTADLVWLCPEVLPDLTERGASWVLELLLPETFADDFGALPVFCFTEEFFSIFLLPATVDDLRTFSVPRVTEESVFLLETLVAEDLSAPDRVLSIDLL